MKKLMVSAVVVLALLGVLVQPMRSAQICSDPNNPAYRLTWEIEEGLGGEAGSEFIFKDPDAKDPCNASGLPFTVKPYGTWPVWARLTGPNNVDPNTLVGQTWLCDTGYDKPAEANYVSYWLTIDRSKATQGIYNLPVEANDGDPNGLFYGGERVQVKHKNFPPSLAAVGAKR
jgi:hypothetical protein